MKFLCNLVTLLLQKQYKILYVIVINFENYKEKKRTVELRSHVSVGYSSIFSSRELNRQNRQGKVSMFYLSQSMCVMVTKKIGLQLRI